MRPPAAEGWSAVEVSYLGREVTVPADHRFTIVQAGPAPGCEAMSR